MIGELAVSGWLLKQADAVAVINVGPGEGLAPRGPTTPVPRHRSHDVVVLLEEGAAGLGARVQRFGVADAVRRAEQAKAQHGLAALPATCADEERVEVKSTTLKEGPFGRAHCSSSWGATLSTSPPRPPRRLLCHGTAAPAVRLLERDMLS